MQPVRLKIEGGAPPTGLQTAEAALRTVPGVQSVRLDPSAGELHVEAAGSVASDQLVAALQAVGIVAFVIG